MRRLEKYLDFVRSLDTSFFIFKIGYNKYRKEYLTVENNVMWQTYKKTITCYFKTLINKFWEEFMFVETHQRVTFSNAIITLKCFSIKRYNMTIIR